MCDLPYFIRARRLERSLTFQQAAQAAGLSWSQWYGLEKRVPRTPPPPDVARAVALALHCSTADVYRACGIDAVGEASQ